MFSLTMRFLLQLSLLLLLCLSEARRGPGGWGRKARRYSRGRGGGRGGGNKISVGTECRLVKKSGGGGGGNCFQEQECGQVCSRVTETQCSTITESECNVVKVPQCRSVLLHTQISQHEGDHHYTVHSLTLQINPVNVYPFKLNITNEPR